MNYFKPNSSQDLHDWFANWDYADKELVKHYVIPMIKFYSIKFKDVLKNYIEDYKHVYLKYLDEGTPEKMLIKYVKEKMKTLFA